jgi:hypothetical protein
MMTSEEWEEVATDPDWESDLGYEMEELTVVKSSTDSQLIFLPEHESQLGEEEFIVVDSDSLRDLRR